MAKALLPHFRIAVVGTGAIGCYYGAKLAYFRRDVHFLICGDVAEIRGLEFAFVAKPRICA